MPLYDNVIAPVEPVRVTVTGPCGLPVYGKLSKPVMTIDELAGVIANASAPDVAGK
jgi:hypothetical protein